MTRSDFVLPEKTIKAIQDMALDSIKLQEAFAESIVPAIQETMKSMSIAAPALRQMAQTVASVKKMNDSMTDALRVFSSSSASVYNMQIREIMSKMIDVNGQMNRVVTELSPKFALLSDYNKVTILPEPIDIRPIVELERTSAQEKIRALENVLAALDKQLGEKEEENKELRRIIKELLEGTKKIHVV